VNRLYEALFIPDGTRFTVEFPDFPEATTCGDDLTDAAYMAQDALQTMVLAYGDLGRSLPAATFNHRPPRGGYAMLVMVNPDYDMEPAFVTTAEAAELLGVSGSRIRAMIRDGVLPSKRTSAGHLIPVQALKERKTHPRPAGRPKKDAPLECVRAPKMAA
jgi:excisionase family DNA binding protein